MTAPERQAERCAFASAAATSLRRSTFRSDPRVARTRSVAARSTPAAPAMLFERIKTFSDSVVKQLSAMVPKDVPAPAPAPVGRPLEGSRATVLVTGATGKTGAAIVRELLSSGVVKNIVAQVLPRSEEVPTEWADSIVTTVTADLATAGGVDTLVQAAIDAGVGSVIFAASGGPHGCAAVDNEAVGRLAGALEAKFRSDVANLFQFPADAAAFAPLDDVVMGGRSSSSMTAWGDAAVFGGNVTTLGGGGFAQTKAMLAASKYAGGADTVDLSAFDGIQLRVRGDGPARTYKLNLKDEDVPDFAFQAMFTVSGTGWRTVRLPFSALVPMKRGKVQYADGPVNGSGMYVRAIDLKRVRTVGIVLSLVSSDVVRVAKVREREGAFALEVRSIGAYRAAPPRFVLVSSAAVTRPFWGAAERAAKGEAMTQIPIVQLNPGQILAHKLAGENALRASALSYAVVRPIGLNDEAPAGRLVRLAQGDVLSGRMNRADVARAVVATLHRDGAACKTFELGVDLEAPAAADMSDVDAEAFARLETDAEEQPYADAVEKMLASAQPPVAVGSQ